MKLTELEPKWVSESESRRGMGIRLWCPLCKREMLVVWFTNPLDGGPPASGQKYLWDRDGDSFETLSLRPSIDASGPPGAIPCVNSQSRPDFWERHWHGHITNGEVTL